MGKEKGKCESKSKSKMVIARVRTRAIKGRRREARGKIQ